MLKKIIVSLAIVLSVLLLIPLVFGVITQKTALNRLQLLEAKINQEMQISGTSLIPSPGIKLGFKDYQLGWFNSKVTLLFQFKSEKEDELDGTQLEIPAVIYHGPLIYKPSAIYEPSWLIARGAMHAEIKAGDLGAARLPAIFGDLAKQTVLEMLFVFRLSNNVELWLDFKPLKWKHVHWKGLKVRVNGSKNVYEEQFTFNGLAVHENDSDVELAPVDYQATCNLGEQGICTEAKRTLDVDGFSLTWKDILFKLQAFRSQNLASVVTDKLKLSWITSFDQMTINKSHYGPAYLDFGAASINAQAFYDLLNFVRHSKHDFSKLTDLTKFQHMIAQAMHDQASLTIRSFDLKTEDGSLSLQAGMKLKPLSEAKIESWRQAVEGASLRLQIAKPLARKLLSHIFTNYLLELEADSKAPITPESRHAAVEAKVDETLQSWTQLGYLTDLDAQYYQLAVHYKDEQFKPNHPMPQTP